MNFIRILLSCPSINLLPPLTRNAKFRSQVVSNLKKYGVQSLTSYVSISDDWIQFQEAALWYICSVSKKSENLFKLALKLFF